MKKISLLVVCLLAGTFCFAAADSPKILRWPTLSRTQIAFTYANDLWIVGRDGGDARRLTTGLGLETRPIFSPDGSLIAFSGEYEGNRDVYVVPAAGGIPRRLTYHPDADEALGWTPDGKRILFRSARNSHVRWLDQLYTMPVEGGGFPSELPLPMGELPSRPMARTWPMSRIPNGRPHGSATAAVRPLPSGLSIWPPPKLKRRFLAKIPTTSIPCG